MTQEQFNELLRSQQGELNAVLMYDGYVITDQKTTNSVKYHHYAIVQLQKNVYLCRQNSTK